MLEQGRGLLAGAAVGLGAVTGGCERKIVPNLT